jgi:hypothetical protein
MGFQIKGILGYLSLLQFQPKKSTYYDRVAGSQ